MEAAVEAAVSLEIITGAPSALSCATFFVRFHEALPLGAPPWITDSWQRLLGSESDLHSKLTSMPDVVVVECCGCEQLLPESGSTRELRSIVARHWSCSV